jgi:hypothetical protein
MPLRGLTQTQTANESHPRRPRQTCTSDSDLRKRRHRGAVREQHVQVPPQGRTTTLATTLVPGFGAPRKRGHKPAAVGARGGGGGEYRQGVAVPDGSARCAFWSTRTGAGDPRGHEMRVLAQADPTPGTPAATRCAFWFTRTSAGNPRGHEMRVLAQADRCGTDQKDPGRVVARG